MNETRPFFIVSSGRSGTYLLHKLFSQVPNVEMHHEHMCTHIQPLALKYHLGFISEAELIKELKKLFGSSVYYSRKKFWGDSSNKLSWIIPVINKIFPEAKFIHLVRDGRKVVSSFYNKLKNECYDNYSTKIMKNWIDDSNLYVEPPPEKKYWWNVPKLSSPFRSSYDKFNQFQRICYHWKSVNQAIEDGLKNIRSEKKFFLKLEDLVSKEKKVSELFKFLEIKYNKKYSKILETPQNVNIPFDFALSEIQVKQFYGICYDLMECYGYDKGKTYVVDYYKKV